MFATTVFFLLFAASVKAADRNDITAYLTDMNNGVKPTDAYIADFLVSPAGVEWRRERGLLPQRDDVVTPAPAPDPLDHRRRRTSGGIVEAMRRRAAARTSAAGQDTPPSGDGVAPVGLVAPSGVVTPNGAVSAPLPDAPPPRLEGESDAAYRERVALAMSNPAAAAPQITAQQQARAEQNAQGLTGLFQSLFKPADPDAAALPGGGSPGGPGSPGAGGKTMSAPKPSMSGSGGAPGAMSLSEMQVAQSGGLGQPFRDMGLKVGAGPGGAAAVMRADGAPASAAEIGELQKRLGREPLAQMQRPDFHQVIPRDKFAELRTRYASKPELRGSTFKDVAATADVRDFQWSRTCGRLDGNCNPNATQGAYTKGRYVAPEDLNNMSLDATKRLAADGAQEKKDAKPTESSSKSFWEKLRAEDAEYRRNVAKERESRQAAGGAPAGRSGFGAMLDALSRALGGGSGEAGSAATDYGASAEAPSYGDAAAASGAAGAGVEAGAPRRDSDVTRMRQVTKSPPAGANLRRYLLGGFMAGLAFLLAVFVRRRMKETA